MSNYRAILIAGPTASGKSATALALAERLGGVIINADSMQVYRELRILSARPSVEDEARAPHALYGFVPAADAYSAGRWLEDMKGALVHAERDGHIPIITGGTGLYFKVLLEGLSPIPEIPGDVRARWRKQAQTCSAEDLYELLCERDPQMAARLKPSDPQRLVRALEVFDATGRSLAQWHDEPGQPLLREGDVARLFVTQPRETLYARIDARFDKMIGEGALDEVRALVQQKLECGLPAMRALGVRPLMQFLRGKMAQDEAIMRAKTETRRYAKRQLTWAKSNMITWKHIFTKDSERFFKNYLQL